MKLCFFLLLFFISYTSFAQNNYIVKTEDGRRVLLKADYTWEYIDAEVPVAQVKKNEIPEPSIENGCNLTDDFEEPKLNKKIQDQLKRGRATIDHIKAKVAKDYDCTVEDVLLLSVSEKKSTGSYTFCANGKKVFYKRTGYAILEKGKLF
ncbi:DUF3157 family protein [Tamlana flava]|uniref:DUF3157 family protein n=1 Tax=Tamlana flava TaxID=3158572 RepID=UPI00351B0C81